MREYNLPDLFLKESNDLIWMINSDFKLMYANNAYLALMKQVTGKEKKLHESVLVEGFGEGYIEKWTTYYEKALKGEHFEIEEHYAHPATSEIQYGQIVFNPVRNEEGQVVAVACQSRDITRIVKQRSEAHQLMDASLDVFCSINEAGNFVFVSKAAFQHWGYAPSELIGLPHVSLILEDDIAKTNEIADAILGGEEVKSFVNRYKRKDGGIAYNLWSARWDNDARLMYCVARDAREKIEQEKLLHQSEQRFKDLVQEGSDLIAILGSEGNYLYVSPTSVSILGMHPEEFIGRSPFEFIHPEDAERTMASLQKITEQPKVQVEPFRFKNKKGEWRWIETVLTDMLQNPAVNGIVANSRDITGKMEEQRKLELFEKVIDSTSDAIIITEAEPLDEPGPRIVYVNEAFVKMTGYTLKEVIGKNPRLLQGPDSNQEDLAALGKKLRRWETAETTVLNYTKSGEPFWVNFAVSPVANQRGWYTHWISVQREVTEQKIKERERELLAEISLNFHRENDYLKACGELCASIGRFGQFDWVELWTLNINHSHLRYLNHFLKDPDDKIFYEETLDVRQFEKGRGLPGSVWKAEKQLLWDTRKDKHDFVRKTAAKKVGFKTVLGIPLVNQGEVIGVLLVGSKQDAHVLDKYTSLFAQLNGFIASEINRKQLEDNLIHLYESIPDIVCVVDFHGNFLKINRAGCELLGYAEEEILHHNFEEFVFPADKVTSGRELANLAKGQSTLAFENRYVKKDGELCWLSWTCNSNEHDTVIYATARNITHEKKLRELTKVTSKLARIGSWEVDVVKNKLFWTEMVHQLHETNPDTYEPVVEEAINFYRKDFRPMVTEAVQQCIQNGTPFDFEAVIVTSGKKERWIRSIGNAEFLDGKCIRIYGSFQDIHERKEAELRLQSLADNLPGVVFQYHMYPDGTDGLKYVTKGAKEVWGYTAQQAMINNQLVWDCIKSGGNFDEVQQSIMHSVQNRTNWSARWKYILPTGEIKRHWGIGTPSFLADGTVIFNSVILDITQDAENEELLTQTAELAKIGSWEMNLLSQEGDAMYWSPMTREILELDEAFSPSSAGGLELHMGESKTRIQQKMDRLIKDGIPFDEEVLVKTGKGNEKWVRVIGQSERIKGKPIKIYGSFQDIHASKSLQLQIREILDSISDAFYAVDAQWKFTYFNKEAENLLQKKEEEVIGKNIWEVFPAASNTALETIYREVVETEKSHSFEYFFPGDGKWYEVNAYPSKGGVSVYFKNINDRKQAAEQLKAAYEERSRILESIGDAFFAVDHNWVVTYWNKEAEKLLGKNREDIVGKHLWTEYADAIDSDFYRQYHKAMETGTTVNFEEYYPTLGKWFEVSAYPSSNNLSVYFKDVTLRKKADLRLVQANERFEKVTEATNDAIWDWNIEENTLYWGSGFKNLFGHKVNRITPTLDSWTQHLHPEDLTRVLSSLDAVVADEQKAIWTAEYRFQKANGDYAFVIDRGIIIRSADGKPSRMVGSMTDISELKRSEEELKMANERFEKATEATNDAIWDWDIEAGVFFRSNAIDKFFGEGTARLLNEKNFWQDKFHPDDLAAIKSSIEKSLADPGCHRWEMEYRIFNQKGEMLYVIDRGLIIRDSNRKAVRMVGAMTDITDRKRFEQELLALNRSLNEQAEELKRSNEELEQFAFVASHDLQEPLRMISSFMDQLRRKYQDQLDDKALQYIYFATDGAKRMKQIILDLLDFSRANRPTDDKEEVDLNEVFAEYKALRRKIIQETNASIQSDPLPVLVTYKAQITQILHCLLDNAIKYSKTDVPPEIVLEVKGNGAYWQFAIKDNGIGIDAQFHDKIFIIFQRLHNRSQYSGTGVGLSIAKRSIEFLGGKIWLQSTPGIGSTFYFTIPKTKGH